MAQGIPQDPETVPWRPNTNSLATNIVDQAKADQSALEAQKALEAKLVEMEKRRKRLELEEKREKQKAAREAMEKKDAAGLPRFAPAPGAAAPSSTNSTGR
jgi:hypothetical protein